MPLNLPPPKSASGPIPSSSAISNHAPTSSIHDTELTTDLPPIASTSKLGLPPPKTKAKLAAAGQAKKFFLDLPKPSTSTTNKDDGQPDGQPAAKKARTGGSGLGALLPEPKRQVTAPATTVASSTNQSHNAAPSLLPHVLKGKAKSNGVAAEQQFATEDQSTVAAQEEPPSAEVLDFFGLSSGPAVSEPAVDFFSIGGPSVAKEPPGNAKPAPAAPARSTPSVSTIPIAPRISAAPAPAAPTLETNYYATLPLPTPKDPYPGFFQKPDGSWAAKRPEEWSIWAAVHTPAESSADEKPTPAVPDLPADFDDTARTNSIEIRAASLRANGGAVDTRPSKVTEEDKKKAEEAKEQQKSQKKFTHVARSRHQLGTLIADAVNNRVELEDRIAQMKSNKRSGGSKYGF